MGIWDSFTDKEETDTEKEAPCPRFGSTCPICLEGRLAYNGKLELVCPACHEVFSAGFT